MRGIADLFFEAQTCKHEWQPLDNPFGSLYKCKKCTNYLINGVLEQ